VLSLPSHRWIASGTDLSVIDDIVSVVIGGVQMELDVVLQKEAQLGLEMDAEMEPEMTRQRVQLTAS
jgi:hypothetical protein